MPRLALQDGTADSPVEQHQLSIHGQGGAGSRRSHAVLQLDQQIAAAENELKVASATLEPKLAELKSRVERTTALNAQVTAALQELAPKPPAAGAGDAKKK